MFICFTGFFASAEVVKIAVVKNKDIQFYEQFISGLKQGLNSSSMRVKIDEYELSDPDTIRTIKESDYSVVCALGTGPAGVLKKEIKDKPIIFSMLLNPAGANIIGGAGSQESNVTGVSMDVSPELQLELLKKNLPSAKKVGLLYSSHSLVFLSELQSAAVKADLEIVSIDVESNIGVPAALKSLAGKVDVLLLCPDNKIWDKDSLSFVLRYGTENRISIVGFAPYLAKAGALMAYSYDFDDLGRQTASLVIKVLNGKLPSEIMPETARKINYVINTSVGDNLGVKFSSDTIKRADVVFK